MSQGRGEEPDFSTIEAFENLLSQEEQPEPPPEDIKKEKSQPKGDAPQEAEEPQEESDIDIEALEEAAAESGQDQDDEQPKQSYKVKVNGEEFEVDAEELVKGYQRNSDYTRKTMELAEKRKEIEAAAKKINDLDQVRSAYSDRLATIEKILQGNEVPQDQLLKVLEEDGAEAYLRVKTQEEARRDHLKQVQAEQQRILQERQQAEVEQWQKQRSYALEQVPELKDKATYEKAKKLFANNGLSEQDLEVLANPAALRIVLMAVKGDEYERALKASREKKAAPVSAKVMKPRGRVEATDRESEEIRSKMDRLKRTGSINDAASVFEHFL